MNKTPLVINTGSKSKVSRNKVKKKDWEIFFSRALLILSLICTSNIFAQEVIPTYSDYLTDNLYLLHPSMVGASNMNKIRLTARQQWFDVEDSPSLQTLNMHAKLGQKTGVGGIVFNDQNGNFSRRGFFGTFAYHLQFSRSTANLNQLSFGVSAGIIQHSFDQSSITEFDPLIGKDKLSAFYFNMDIGASYYISDFFVHLTAKNILPVKQELFFSDAVPVNQRKYLFSTGYVFEDQGSSWKYQPSMLFQWREATDEKNIDANFKVFREFNSSTFFGGISFRRSLDGAEYSEQGKQVQYENLQYLTPFAGFEYRNFLFAYTYSHQLNSIVMSKSGYHQITLGYNFGEKWSRYECYCPGVNQ